MGAQGGGCLCGSSAGPLSFEKFHSSGPQDPTGSIHIPIIFGPLDTHWRALAEVIKPIATAGATGLEKIGALSTIMPAAAAGAEAAAAGAEAAAAGAEAAAENGSSATLSTSLSIRLPFARNGGNEQKR